MIDEYIVLNEYKKITCYRSKKQKASISFKSPLNDYVTYRSKY